jgi:hypothetical protein
LPSIPMPARTFANRIIITMKIINFLLALLVAAASLNLVLAGDKGSQGSTSSSTCGPNGHLICDHDSSQWGVPVGICVCDSGYAPDGNDVNGNAIKVFFEAFLTTNDPSSPFNNVFISNGACNVKCCSNVTMPTCSAAYPQSCTPPCLSAACNATTGLSD